LERDAARRRERYSTDDEYRTSRLREGLKYRVNKRTADRAERVAELMACPKVAYAIRFQKTLNSPVLKWPDCSEWREALFQYGSAVELSHDLQLETDGSLSLQK
jgi:hypothetical protein